MAYIQEVIGSNPIETTIIGEKLKWYKLLTVNQKIGGSSPLSPAMEKLKVEDKSRIDNVVFYHPELMNEEASELVKVKYARMISLSKTLQDKRAEVRSLEEKEKKVKEEWERISKICTYTHPTIEKEYYKGECNFAIKGHGNDIIGKTTVM